jgi:hypothetical protein
VVLRQKDDVFHPLRTLPSVDFRDDDARRRRDARFAASRFRDALFAFDKPFVDLVPAEFTAPKSDDECQIWIRRTAVREIVDDLGFVQIAA